MDWTEVERKRNQGCHQVLWPELLHWMRWCIFCYVENVKITFWSDLKYLQTGLHTL